MNVQVRTCKGLLAPYRAYYQTERAKGRTPTGAELDQIAGTNNYGRKVLRRWHHDGRIRDWACVVDG